MAEINYATPESLMSALKSGYDYSNYFNQQLPARQQNANLMQDGSTDDKQLAMEAYSNALRTGDYSQLSVLDKIFDTRAKANAGKSGLTEEQLLLAADQKLIYDNAMQEARALVSKGNSQDSPEVKSQITIANGAASKFYSITGKNIQSAADLSGLEARVESQKQRGIDQDLKGGDVIDAAVKAGTEFLLSNKSVQDVQSMIKFYNEGAAVNDFSNPAKVRQIVVAFNKALEPTSAVMEGDYQSTLNKTDANKFQALTSALVSLLRFGKGIWGGSTVQEAAKESNTIVTPDQAKLIKQAVLDLRPLIEDVRKNMLDTADAVVASKLSGNPGYSSALTKMGFKEALKTTISDKLGGVLGRVGGGRGYGANGLTYDYNAPEVEAKAEAPVNPAMFTEVGLTDKDLSKYATISEKKTALKEFFKEAEAKYITETDQDVKDQIVQVSKSKLNEAKGMQSGLIDDVPMLKRAMTDKVETKTGTNTGVSTGKQKKSAPIKKGTNSKGGNTGFKLQG